MRSNSPQTLRLVRAASGALFALLCIGVVLHPGGAGRVWRGYLTIAVRGDISSSTLSRRLAARGLRVLSPDTAMVEIADFSGSASLPVAKLPDRLDPLDPRYDPYLHDSAGFFHAGAWEIVYVQSRGFALLLLTRIASALRGLDWRTPDFVPLQSALSAAVMLLLAGALLSRYTRSPRELRRIIAIGAAPWVTAAAWGSPQASLAAAIGFAVWCVVAEAGYTSIAYLLEHRIVEVDRLRLVVVVTALCVVAAAAASAVPPSRQWSLLLAAGATVAWLACVATSLLLRGQVRLHALFYPVEILGKQRLRGMRRVALPKREVLIVALLVFMPLSEYFVPPGNIEIPAPVVYPGLSSFSWKALAALWKNRTASDLPDLSEFLAHRAYQEGLAYGRGYSFPARNEKLSLVQYSHDGQEIAAKGVVVQVYNARWIRHTLSSPTGVARLLEAQRSPTRTIRRPLGARMTAASLLLCLASALLAGGAVSSAVRGREVDLALEIGRAPVAARSILSSSEEQGVPPERGRGELEDEGAAKAAQGAPEGPGRWLAEAGSGRSANEAIL